MLDSGESSAYWRKLDGRLQEWFDTPFHAAFRTPTWETWTLLGTLLVVIIQWTLLGGILSGCRGGEEGTVWLGLSVGDISAVYRWGFFLSLPGLILAAGNRRWALLFAMLALAFPLAIAGSQAWPVGGFDARLAQWHHQLLYQQSIEPSVVPSAGWAPIDWPIGWIARSGVLGNTSLALVWLQCIAIALSMPALVRLLRLDFGERPRLMGFILYAYALSAGWSTLFFDAGRVCWAPALLFCLVWAVRRCRRKRAWLYGALLLSTGSAGALLLAGYGLYRIGRREIGLGVPIVLAAWLYNGLIGNPVWIQGWSPAIHGTIEVFSLHDRSFLDFILGWACLPLLAPEVLCVGIPAAIASLFRDSAQNWAWPGAWTAVLSPLLAVASARVLARWSKARLPGVWLAASVLLVLTVVKNVEDWPGRMDKIPVSQQEYETVTLLNAALDLLQVDGTYGDTRFAVPALYVERVSHLEHPMLFPGDGEANADWILATVYTPSWPEMDRDEYRKQLRALQHDPQFGLVDKSGDALIFQRGAADRISFELPEDRWNAQIVSHDIPNAVIAGTTFTASITVQNLGKETWTSEENCMLGTWLECDPFQPGGSARAILSGPVPQNQTITLPLPIMTAPKEAGDYTARWGMLQEHVRWFGDVVEVTVAVVEP